MIINIKFNEEKNGVNLLIDVNFENKTLLYIKNDLIIKKDNVDVFNLEELINKIVIYWNREYIDNSMIDGIKSKLEIKTNSEILIYIFKNKFPNNYDEFVSKLKSMVNNDECK